MAKIKEETKRLTIELPVDIIQSIKVDALKARMSVSNYIGSLYKGGNAKA